MNRFVEQGIEFHKKNIPFMYVLILEKHGSAPRGPGAGMLVPKKGDVIGTIGGGAIEYECIKKARKWMEKGRSTEESYELTNRDAQHLGMVCGGKNRVGFFYFGLDKKEDWEELAHNPNGKYMISLDKKNMGELFLDQDVIKKEWKEQTVVSIDGKNYFFGTTIDRPRIFIFGGGHVARGLSKILSILNFDLHVVEDRKEFIMEEDFPRGIGLYCIDVQDVQTLGITSKDYVCVMTRGHKSDTEILCQLLQDPPYYIGVIGSQKKVVEMKKQLKAQGFEEKVINEIYSPIGLAIGAQTPEEIGVSIAAEIIKIFRLGKESTK